VVDCGETTEHAPYLVMELLAGEDLRSLLEREGALPLRRAAQLVLEACRGLAVVHASGLVHRDVKPENLFVTRRATGEDWCKVLDFGVAKMDSSLSTAEGAIVGTVRYMAPEQLLDGAAVGTATDVYALGAILYECLAGQPLARGESVPQVMYGIMNVAPPPLRALLPRLPSAVTELVEHCTSKAPEDRPPSVLSVAAALESILDDTRTQSSSNDTVAENVTRLPTKARVRRRSLIPVAVAAIAAASAAGWLDRGAFHPRLESKALASSVAPSVQPEAMTTAPPPQPERSASAAPATALPAASTPPQQPRSMVTRRPPAAAASATPERVDRRFDDANPYAD
jgi:serine/threonine protein kinase